MFDEGALSGVEVTDAGYWIKQNLPKSQIIRIFASSMHNITGLGRILTINKHLID
jgi:hypothetical protein